jgi:aminopeptidase Y
MRALPAVLLLATALAVLAGCGGGAGGEGSTSAATTAAPAGAGRQAPSPAAGAGDPWTHMQALSDVAAANGRTRAAGTPGGAATERLIAERLRVAGWSVRVQRVGFPFFDERRAPVVTLPGGRRLRAGAEVRTLEYSAGGSAHAAVVVVGGDRRDAGCGAADWRAFPRGRIAMVRRGTCAFAAKARAAQSAGAAAVIVSDPPARGAAEPVRGTLGAPGVRVPVVTVAAGAGRALAGARGAVGVRVDAVSERRTARNVVAELRGRDGARTVMAGAHLDSVPDGPGINDDGSGVAALLALATRLAAAPRPRDTVRLGFWTAEELGLHGSRRHVAVLSAGDRRRIRAYVNLDMVASPNAVLQTYGAGAAETALRRALDARGPAPVRTAIGGASDHAPFQRAGVPVAGVFTGASERVSPQAARRFRARAGRPADPCYHRACDTLENANHPMLERVTDAVDAALRSLAG